MRLIFLSLLLVLSYFKSSTVSANTLDRFNDIENSKNWHMSFKANGNWRDQWFLDGKKAKVYNEEQALVFTSGSEEMNPEHHAVLWTKKSFGKSVKIEYEYTRLDTVNKWATMIYILATGRGTNDSPVDISSWINRRSIPYMKTYFENMNLLHISYASYGPKDVGIEQDYIRARRYPLKEGGTFNSDTKIEGDIFNTGMFHPNEIYKITIIKHDKKLYMQVTHRNTEKTKLINWDTSSFPEVTSGRIGLRHMWGKSAIYNNFTVFELK